jgi:hypothetical protein
VELPETLCKDARPIERADRVERASSGRTGSLQYVYPGRAVLTGSGGSNRHATDQVTIGGTTQTAFTVDANPDGNELASYGGTLKIDRSNDNVPQTAVRRASNLRTRTSSPGPRRRGSLVGCSAGAPRPLFARIPGLVRTASGRSIPQHVR